MVNVHSVINNLGGYKIAPMASYFPISDSTDNSLTLLQKIPEQSMGYFCLTGDNNRMGLTGVPGAATYIFYREIKSYGSIVALTSQGVKTRIWNNGTLGAWQSHVTPTELFSRGSAECNLIMYNTAGTKYYFRVYFSGSKKIALFDNNWNELWSL